MVKNTILTEFNPVGIVSTKKKLLSSAEIEVWECPCKKVNDRDQEYCSNCRNDIYGFSKEEIKPKDVVALLDERIVILQEMFV